MKNILLGLIITIITIASGIYVLTEKSVDVEATIGDDEFSQDYSIGEHIYTSIDVDGVITRMNEEETFILFIGRPTCPYCQKTVPVLNNVAIEFGYDQIHYLDSSLEDNQPFLVAQGIDSVPFTAFIKDGVSVMVVPGFVEEEVFKEILNEIN